MSLSNIFISVINEKQITNLPIQDLNNNYSLTKGSLINMGIGGIGGGIIEPLPPPPTVIDDPDLPPDIIPESFMYEIDDVLPYNRPNFSLFSSRPRLKLGSSLSGKVTAGSVAIGSTKGIASSKRILTHCKQTSGDIQFCASQIIPQVPVVQQDILFNTSSFDRYDIPEKYKIALSVAVKRWGKYIKYNKEFIELVRNSRTTVTDYKNWSGLELIKFEINTTGNYKAKATTFYIGATSIQPSFELRINSNQMIGLSQADINDVITHELGHALGFNFDQIVRVNGQESGEELIPNIRELVLFNNTVSGTAGPIGFTKPYFSRIIDAYNSYGGTREYVNGSYSRVIQGTNMPIEQNESWGGHMDFVPFYSKELIPGTQIPRYAKLGLGNDIMTVAFTAGKRMYISEIDIGFLLDIYTNSNGKNYKNYDQKTSGSEVKTYKVINGRIYFNK